MTALTYKITDRNGKTTGEVKTYEQAEAARLKGYMVTACYTPIEEPIHLSDIQKANRIKI